MDRNIRTVLLLVLIVLGAVAAISGATRPLELRLLDLQFRSLRAWAPQPVEQDVAVIGIDEETARRLPEPVTLWHRHLGQLFTALAAARPSVVGVDLVLPDRGFDAVAPGYDLALMKGLIAARHAYPIVLAITVDPATGRQRELHKPLLAAAGGDDATGYALLGIDADGVLRRFDERLGDRGEKVATLAGQMARRIGIDPGDGLIDYAAGPRYDYVPMHRVLDWAAAGDTAALARAFAGRPVLMGTVFRYEDRQRLPVALAAWETDEPTSPGVLVHAQIVRNLLGRGLVTEAAPVALAALAPVVALLWLVSGRLPLLVLVYAVFGAGLIALSTALLARGVHYPVAWGLLLGLAALAGRNGYEALLQLRERRRLRSAFGGYVSPAIMQEILAGGIQPQLGGVKRFVCILFSDIRGYTTRSEGMTPEQVLGFLNRYFEDTVAIIHRHGGSVVCFMGDGIMAVFGAPNSLQNPCANAFAAGREMLESVTEFNAKHRLAGEQPVEIGVGLHAGPAVIGHVGSSTRHDYTAIGDVTNVASRLEGLTKEAGYRMVCSRTVTEMLPDSVALAPLGPMAIKGHTPVDVWGYDKV